MDALLQAGVDFSRENSRGECMMDFMCKNVFTPFMARYQTDSKVFFTQGQFDRVQKALSEKKEDPEAKSVLKVLVQYFLFERRKEFLYVLAERRKKQGKKDWSYRLKNHLVAEISEFL